MQRMNIYIIGYRGSGKTSVGSHLAERLGWAYMDTDDRLVEKEGISIREIVSQRGWAAFRQLEKAVVKETCLLERHVVATGGGVVLDPDNIETMKTSGTVVWLKASPEIIKERLGLDRKTNGYRPALTRGGTLEEIETVLAERLPLYEAAGHISVETDHRSVQDICDEILSNRLKALRSLRLERSGR